MSDGDGRLVLVFGGWGLGGIQCREMNKRAGALTLAVYHMAPDNSIAVDVPRSRDRRAPEHK